VGIGTYYYYTYFAGDGNYSFANSTANGGILGTNGSDTNGSNGTGGINTTPGNVVITVDPVGNVSYNDTIVINATIVDNNGDPIPGLNVDLIINGTVVGNGTTDINGNISFNYTVPEAGNYTYEVIFPGNPNYLGNSSGNQTFEARKLNTTTTVANTVAGAVGETINLTAHLVDEYGYNLYNKTINFYVNGVYIGNGTTDLNGNAFINYTIPGVGSYSYTAYFPGDNNYNPSNSTANGVLNGTGNINITIGSLTIITDNITGARYNDTVQFNATVKDLGNNSVSGINIIFYINGSYVGSGVTDSNGIASINYTIPSTGNYTLVAGFSGNANYSALNSSVVYFEARKLNTNTTVAAGVAGSVGEIINLTATLKDENGFLLVGKNVSFYVNGIFNGTAITGSNGVAVLAYKIPAVGTYYYTAYFPGDGNYTSSNSTLNGGLVSTNGSDSNGTNGTGGINTTPGNVVITVDPIVNVSYNDTITINATVVDKNGDPIPGLNVELIINGTNVANGTTDVNGNVSFNYTVPEAGNYTYEVIFPGNPNYLGNSSGNQTFEARKLNTTTTVANTVAGAVGETINLTAHLVDEHGILLSNKTVFFYVNGILVGNGTTDSYGNTYINYTILGVGSYTYTAYFFGDNNYNPSNSTTNGASNGTGTINITAGNLNITVSPVVGAKYNDTVTINATVLDNAGNPISGISIDFYINGVFVGNQTAVNGTTSINYTIPSAGNFYLIAGFAGNTNYTAKNSSAYYGVFLKLNTTIVVGNLSGGVGQTINITGTLYDEYGRTVANKTVKFYVDGVLFKTSTTDSSGIATVNYTISNIGTHNFYLVFDGDGNYTGINSSTIANGSGSGSINATAGNLTININNATGKYNYTTILESTIVDSQGNPVSNLSVDFYVDGVYVGSGVTNSLGVAKYNYTVYSAGTFPIVAQYNGSNPNYNPVNSTPNTGVFGKQIPEFETPNINGEKYQTISLNTTLENEEGNPMVGETVDFYLNGGYIGSNITDVNGIAQFSYTFNNIGTFTYYTYFSATGNYTDTNSSTARRGSGNGTINIFGTLTITVDNITAKFKDDVVLNATVIDQDGNPAPGTLIDFYVGGVYVGSNVTDTFGIAHLDYHVYSAGNFTILGNFSGNGTYHPTNGTGLGNFAPIGANITVIDIVSERGDIIGLTATVIDEYGNPVVGETIKFYINGVYVGSTLTGVNGVAVLAYPNDDLTNPSYYYASIDLGNYTAYNSSGQTNGTGKITITAGKVFITVPDVVGKYNETVALTATVVNKNGAPIKGLLIDFYIDGMKVGSGYTNVDGVATYHYEVKKVGVFPLVGQFNGNSKWLAANGTATATLLGIDTITTADIVYGISGQDTKLVATLHDEYGNPLNNMVIVFYVNDHFYGASRTNANGEASINFNYNSSGSLTFYGAFLGFGPYNPSNSSNSGNLDNTSDVIDIISGITITNSTDDLNDTDRVNGTDNSNLSDDGNGDGTDRGIDDDQYSDDDYDETSGDGYDDSYDSYEYYITMASTGLPINLVLVMILVILSVLGYRRRKED